MFKKIPIANRGEIALRVICACKELGYQRRSPLIDQSSRLCKKIHPAFIWL